MTTGMEAAWAQQHGLPLTNIDLAPTIVECSTC